MVLSDHDIKIELASGRIVLEPFDEHLIQPASIDVRLGRDFRVFRNSSHVFIDPQTHQPDLTEQIVVGADDAFVLHPGQFALGTTLERIAVPDDVLGKLEGKSSLGRLGILTHSTAGFIDPGFEGHITLELSNVSTLPVKLWPGMKIGQMCFFQLSSPAEHPYGSAGSHYQGQRGPTPSRSYQNFYRAQITD